ncbi:MAG: M6 family metalloprotease domain-containing protein [Clostridiales bacterium]|nr:M6 family metalloprotease domain-containing protein [Clostridiales bacterium]
MRVKNIFCVGLSLGIMFGLNCTLAASNIERVAPKPDVYNFYKIRDDIGEDKRYIIESFKKKKALSVSNVVNENREKILVIPLEFKDIKFESDDIKRDCENMMEEVKKYYEINSSYQKGKKGITIDYTVTDKVTSEQDMVYYAGAYVSLFKELDETVGIDEMAKEAVSILKESGFEFEEYDNDGDGVIDHIIIVHAGGGKEETPNSDLIWSHRWEIQNNGVSLGRVRALNYTTVPEKSTIGVIVHELGHDFGLPDLYDTFSVSQGVGVWDLMGAGSWNRGVGQNPGECPSNLSAWSREFLGWGDIEEVDESRELTFSNTDGISNIYKIYLKDKYGRKNKNEYYLIEYRRRINYDEGLPGEGILIWHIDNKVIDKKMFINEVNNEIENQGVSLIQADGKFHLNKENEYNFGDAGDPFPGCTQNNIFAAMPYALNFSNKGEYSFIEGKNFIIDGDKAKMYIDVDMGMPNESIKTYAPLDGSAVCEEVVFSFGRVDKCSEYKLQISKDRNFLNPLQYTINASKEKMEVMENKIVFSKYFRDVLDNNTKYYWRVAATNPLTKMKNIKWSNVKDFYYTKGEVIEAPGNFVWEALNNKLNVSWVKEEDVSGYIVLYNGEEIYSDKNIFEGKNELNKCNIRVRSINNGKSSKFSDRLIIPKAEDVCIIAKTIGGGEKDGMLPTDIILMTDKGIFKENGNYNKSTIHISRDTLPYGMKQGSVNRIDDSMVDIELERNDSFVLTEDAKLSIKVSRHLLNGDCDEDVEILVPVLANNKYYIHKMRFSFSGANEGKIVGTRDNMEYSVDGGVTYTNCDNKSTTLTKDDLKKINEIDGIIVREKKEEDKYIYHVINILNNNRKPALVIDHNNKLLRGLTNDMEFSFDGVNWNDNIDELKDIDSLVAVRYKGKGRVKYGESTIYDFRNR